MLFTSYNVTSSSTISLQYYGNPMILLLLCSTILTTLRVEDPKQMFFLDTIKFKTAPRALFFTSIHTRLS